MPTAALLDHLAQAGIRLGTETTRRLLAELGNPQDRTTVVLIAGTNGKGSTAALLAAMAVAAGYRTGLYTSPHLEDVEEQLRVDGRAIDGETLCRRLTEVMIAAGRALETPPTLFEAMTASALLHFAAEGCALAVLEAGMGGRRDATNATEPDLSLITSVGLDHRDTLGPDLRDIAVEKAGILRAGRPGLIARFASSDADAAIRAAASRLGAHLIGVPERVSLRRAEPQGWTGQRVVFETPRHRHTLFLPLLGEHQVQNLLLATLAAETLRELGWDGFTPEAVAAGVSGCRWPGRIEQVPLPSGKIVVLDAAHNPQGVESLVRFLDQAGEPFDLVFGVLADKEAAAMLRPLACRARHLLAHLSRWSPGS